LGGSEEKTAGGGVVKREGTPRESIALLESKGGAHA